MIVNGRKFATLAIVFGPSKIIMKALLPSLLLASTLAAFAHPDHDQKPGESPTTAVTTGNGEWTYTAVPHWGELPDGKKIGPTHGSVLVGPKGNIYVSTDGPQSILVYDAAGKHLKNIAPDCQGFHAMMIREENGKSYIYGAQLNAYGNKSLEKKTPLRVCKIDLDGKLVMQIPNEKTEKIKGGWGGLTAVTVAPDGSIFACTGYGANVIHKFDAEGKLLKSFGSRGKGDGQFVTCHGLAIDTRFGEPRLLVADRENRRLTHFTLDGEWIGVHATNLRRPCSVSIHGDHLAVAELEARVTILDKTGTPVSFLGDNPNRKEWANFGVPKDKQQLGIFTAPHGLTFDPDGNLYVQDWNTTGRVTKLVKKK